jgi:hypothetical protein
VTRRTPVRAQHVSRTLNSHHQPLSSGNTLNGDPSQGTTPGEQAASGEEREQWWARATAVWPDYDNYQTKTERQIPIVILEPIEG